MISLEEYRARIGGFRPHVTLVRNIDTIRKKFGKMTLPSDEVKLKKDKGKLALLCVLFLTHSLAICSASAGIFKDENDNTMSRNLIMTLLMIGNVESNPGPVTSSVEREEIILAKLVSTAMNIEVKRIIGKITSLTNAGSMFKTLSPINVVNLSNVASHILNWSTETEKSMKNSLKKEGLIHLIVRRLNALYPVPCPNCETVDELDPLLHLNNDLPKCIKCDKSMCSSCFQQEKITISNSKNFNKNIFFVCPCCLEEIKAADDFDINFLKKGKSLPVVAGGKDNVDESNATAADKSDGEKPPPVKDKEKDKSDSEKLITIEDNSEQTTSNPKKKSDSTKKTCTHFALRNNCKFGINGKGCEFTHPKVCQRYQKSGFSSRGCRRGSTCKFFHQKICRSSERGEPCNKSRDECTFIHPRIYQQDGNQFHSQNQQQRYQQAWVQPQSQPQSHHQRQHFLGVGQEPLGNDSCPTTTSATAPTSTVPAPTISTHPGRCGSYSSRGPESSSNLSGEPKLIGGKMAPPIAPPLSKRVIQKSKKITKSINHKKITKSINKKKNNKKKT